MKSKRFYLACLRDTVGTNVAFHGKEGRGYVTDIRLAEEYTLEAAQRKWNTGREFDLPLCADKVDALSVYHVDCQKLPSENDIPEGCESFVAFQNRRWDGNDVYWLQDAGLPTTDFSLAKVYPKPVEGDDLVWVPFDRADAVKRPTLNVRFINRRKMIQAAGLVMPDHVKRDRRRKPSSGKVRWNCPGCGKLHWQYNPYDFDGCRFVGCNLFSASAML